MTWSFINDRFINEDEASLHIRDLSIQRGYGIFDFLKVQHGRPLFIEDHLDRFYFSADQMHLQLRHDRTELKQVIESMLQKNNAEDCGIRITLTGGYSGDGYQLAEPNLIISQHSVHAPSKELFDKGIKLSTHNFQRQLPTVKTIDYLMAIWMQPALKKNGTDDILYHNNDVIRECPRANIFFVTADDKLITPVANILRGVTRKKILSIATDFMQVEERDITIDELPDMKEAFITSTTKAVLPVQQVDEMIFPGRDVSARLLSLLRQLQAASTVAMAEKS